MTGMEKLRFRWVVLALSWFGWLLLGIALLSLGVMLVKLIPQFGLTGIQAGALMAVSAIPSIAFAIPIGSLADRYGGRRLGALGFLAAISSAGSLVLPLIMGLVFDTTGSWALTWTVPAIVAFVGAIVVLFSKN